MGTAWERVKARIRIFFSIDFIPKSFRLFTVVHTGLIVSTLFSGQFINLFFLNIVDDIHIVMIFTMITYATSGVMMLAAAVFLRYCSPKTVMRIGFSFYIIQYILLLVLREKSVTVMPLMGILQGSGGAFYWINYFYLYTEYTQNENRDVSGAFIGLATSVSQLTVPLLSGFIISRFVGFKGYIIVFFLAFVSMIFSSSFSTRLPKIQPNYEVRSKPLHLQAIKLVFSDKRYLTGFLTETTRGVREGIILFLLNVVLFKLIKSELVVGVNSFLSAFLGICGIWAMGKILNPGNRIKAMTISITLLIAFGLLLVLKSNAATVILFSSINAAVYPFFTYPEINIFLLLLQKLPGSAKYQPEMYGIREVFLATGRCAGVILFLLLPRDYWELYAAALVGVTAFQYITILLCKRSEKIIKELSGCEEN